MRATPTADDEGKTVLNAKSESVASPRSNTAHIAPDPGFT